ncbi:uncharacterized protein KGF55_001893 [Candida pseudojiufengensis]|uniref:uncharacterized protein n=1 Tax=Candida pseudojiufengensis TaxID=497109 RepID=UPI0022255FFF|nr:uncharacterized protein KGF55_001893 [Candida pseudojiufengensis]KAI5964823.1 hypothetical protein KGF55_001893 [Candida pseudojiufengensis]
MKVLPGVHVKENQILKLNKSLYGLKQSPNFWNRNINYLLTKNEIKALNLKLIFDIKDRTYSSIYGDDNLIASDTAEQKEEIKTFIEEELQNEKHGSTSKISWNEC